MPEAAALNTDPPTAQPDPLAESVQAAADGLRRMVAQAEAVQRQRAEEARAMGAPRWTDVFTTQFTEFTNRPR